jgi:hypothetical protein
MLTAARPEEEVQERWGISFRRRGIAMTRIERISRSVVLCLTTALCAGVGSAQQVFGTKDYTVTKISALSFVPADSGLPYHTSGSLGRYGDANTDTHFYATFDWPSGSTLDYIGLTNLNDGTPGVISVSLLVRAGSGVSPVVTVTSTPHTTWAIDKNPTPFNQTVYSQDDGIFILDVETASSPNLQFFAGVEIWWKRNVGYPPGAPQFSDVPPTHQFYKFVEALAAAGITAGYGDGRFGVNDPVTRGQMAVFISDALGLHWPQ